MMNQIEIVKSNILALYRSQQVVHASIRTQRSATENQDLHKIVVKAVYTNIFVVEDMNAPKPQTYTFQYVDVITKDIDIKELEGVLPKPVEMKHPRRRNI